MKREEFLHRSVTIKSEEFDGMEVVRTRTSTGFSSITLTVPHDKQMLTLTISNNDETEAEAGIYERKVEEIGMLISKITGEPCDLPEGWESEKLPWLHLSD